MSEAVFGESRVKKLLLLLLLLLAGCDNGLSDEH